VTGLILTTRGGMVVGRVTSGADAWPWVSARYSGGGRLVVCGFPIVASWGHGPTPRFLLLRLLEWLAKTETKLKEEGP